MLKDRLLSVDETVELKASLMSFRDDRHGNQRLAAAHAICLNCCRSCTPRGSGISSSDWQGSGWKRRGGRKR